MRFSDDYLIDKSLPAAWSRQSASPQVLFPCLASVIVVSDRHLSRSAVVMISTVTRRERLLVLPVQKSTFYFSFPPRCPYWSVAGSPSQLFMHTVNAAGMCDVESVWPVLVSLHSGANPPALGFAFTVRRSWNCTRSSPARISQRPAMFFQGLECIIMCQNEQSHN